LADICGQLLHKGDKVYVDGRIQYRDWKTDDGQERKITEIVIDNMMLLNGRSGGSYQGDDSYAADGMDAGDFAGGGQPSAGASTSSKGKAKAAPAADEDVIEAEDISDDIPF
jgi:single-strand DNA-binding protein